MKEVVITVGSAGELEIPDEFRKELALQAPRTQLRVVLRDDRVIELRAAEAKPLEGQRDPDQRGFGARNGSVASAKLTKTSAPGV